MNINSSNVLELIKSNVGGHVNFFLIILKNNGDILETPSPESNKFDALIQYLIDAGNIRKVFDISSDPLGSIPSTSSFFIRKQVNLFPSFEAFHTSLPVWTIQFLKISEDAVTGIVKMADLLPNIFEHSSRGFIYINDDNRLVGFNGHFYDCFKSVQASPNLMLDQPVSDFLSPTPAAFQEKSVGAIVPEQSPSAWERIPLTNGSEKFITDTFNRQALDKGYPFQGIAPHGSFLSIQKPFDPSRQDLRLKIRFGENKNRLPMVVLGDADTTLGCPDDNGYLIGLDSDSHRMLLKKRGYVVVSSPYPLPAGVREMELFRIGNAFLLFLDGKRVFGYFDCDPIQRDSFHVSLYLRDSWSCTIESVEAFVKPVKNPPEKTDMIVQAGSPDPKHFLVIPFTSSTLSAAFQGIHGFYLQDIARMQNQMDTLKKQYQALQKEDEKLKSELEQIRQGDQQFIGVSKPVLKIREQVEKAAGTRSTILIQGPTGTGKEVLAKYIHGKSLFNKGPFLKVDCSLLPKTLMESELFGHEKGAFTGATGQKTGLLEQADNGTVFLDEVNNLTLDTQVKLLQFLQDLKITRVGGQNPIALNTRIIVASNVDLKKMASQGMFREDLYYRMAVITIDLPPLIRRLEDLPALCDHFLKMMNRIFNKNIRGISPLAFKKLFDHRWSGNIRELRNVLERAVLFCDTRQIEPDDLRLAPDAGEKPGQLSRKKFTAVELSKENLMEAFKRNRGVIKNLALELGVSRYTLYYHFRKLGIEANRLRENPRKSKDPPEKPEQPKTA